MADGTRLRYDGVETYLAAQLDSAALTIQFDDFLKSDGGSPIDSLVGDEYMALTILDANYRLQEIVHLTAYDSTALTGTIERGQEGTSAKTHASGSKVVHSTTVVDFTMVQDHDQAADAHPEILEQANQYTDTELAAHNDDGVDTHPGLVRKDGDTLSGDFVFSQDADGNTVTIEGTLVIASAAELVVDGDLVINGRFFLNGREVVASNDPPASPTPNVIWIQTYG